MEVGENRRVGKIDRVRPYYVVVIVNVLVVVLVDEHVVLECIAHLHTKLAKVVHFHALLLLLESEILYVLLEHHIIERVLVGVTLIVDFG